MSNFGVTYTPPSTGPGVDDYEDYVNSEYDPRDRLGEYEGFNAENLWEAVDFARDSQAYMGPEGSMAALEGQFKSYRSWWEILGLSYEMTKVANSGDLNLPPGGPNSCCDGWEKLFRVPELGHMIQYTRDAQASYVNRLQDETTTGGGHTFKRWGYTDIGGVQWEQLQYFYADIITDREDLWQEVIDAIEAGTTPRTPLEIEALALAEQWREEIKAGGSSRAQALIKAGFSDNGGEQAVVSPALSLPPLSLSALPQLSLGSILPATKLPPWQTLALVSGTAYLIYKVVL